LKCFLVEFTSWQNSAYKYGGIAISCGLFKISETDESVAYLIDRAVDAKKEAKKNKADTTVVLFDTTLMNALDRERSIVGSMVNALKKHEFKAFLQPKVSVKTGMVVGAEALVRWIKADNTVIYPDQFIELFERNGFITRVDYAVLDTILDYLTDAISKKEPVVPVSVNFSRRHHDNEDFAKQLYERISEANIPPELIEAEITESSFMGDINRLANNIDYFRERGVKVSIDDFGSGYSSLNMLIDVNVDTIKLDRFFMKNLEDKPGADIIVKHIIKMLKDMGFEVLIEGVETKEQLDMLKGTECDVIQGYYYSKPMPIPEFRKYIAEFKV
ncbi:MAG: EAL domain-containing protein, partial [Lachnospiraceae bacterium]|nr:EAL domain-containing protein [Lachnospiraceae bacterium]